jgi:hypothetical protein
MEDNNKSKQRKSSAWYRQLVLPGRTQSPVVKMKREIIMITAKKYKNIINY